jgi:flavin reductase (DIM6/NTAB) family NADH-FMN oxidoreductase RutF
MTAASLESLQDAFRTAMASVCTPVAVVTAMDDDRPHGTTVSAFASLSMSPPSVLVSLDQGSEVLALLRRTGRFGLNILGHDQAELATGFARKGSDKFAGVPWSLADGVPRLFGSPGWVACGVEQAVEAADHVVVIGTVRSVETLDGAPLTYHARTFGTHRILGQA